MEKEIALVQSKTFWAATLGLVAVVAKGLNVSWLLSFAADPHSIDMILNVVTGLMFVAAIATRKAAVAKVTGFLTPATGDKTLYAFPPLTFLALAAAVAAASPQGCNDQAVKDALARIRADIKSVEQVAAEAAPELCLDIQTLEATGEVVLSSGLLGAGDVAHARTVEAAINALCANPTQQNTAAIVSRGVAAYIELASLLKKVAPK